MASSSAAVQQEIVRVLSQAPDQTMPKRDLERKLHAVRFGTSVWWKAYSGLIADGWMSQTGEGTKQNPFTVTLLRQPGSVDGNGS